MTVTEQVVKGVIRRLLKGDDYRVEVVSILDAEFLQFAIDFFKKVVHAKMKGGNVDIDWYRRAFLDPGLPSDDMIINAGLNKKTISNMYNSASREIVINASREHYESLRRLIEDLVSGEPDTELTLTIKFQGVGVDLSVSESLVVINALAVKRAALRGGLWSAAGKRVEKPLMQTLCKLHQVPERNYKSPVKSKRGGAADFEREVDFYLTDGASDYKCEVKLMGKGNPESADAVIARGSKVFVADKLSDTNKKQLNSLKVEWVELRHADGFKRFATVLARLGIPHRKLSGGIDDSIERIFADIFK